VLEEELHSVLVATARDLGDAVDEEVPALPVGGLERIVVALDPGPDDEVRAEGAGEVGGGERQANGLAAYALVR
jgi:hypothetical protein